MKLDGVHTYNRIRNVEVIDGASDWKTPPCIAIATQNADDRRADRPARKNRLGAFSRSFASTGEGP
jgi:hypothetical protein